MTINPFRKMQNYIELSKQVSPGGQIDTDILYNYVKDDYDNILNSLYDRISNGAIGADYLSMYIDLKDVKYNNPSEILPNYYENSTNRYMASMGRLLKSIILQNNEFFKEKRTYKEAKERLWVDYGINCKEDGIQNPFEELKKQMFFDGFNNKVETDNNLNELLSVMKNNVIDSKNGINNYVFDGKDGRLSHLFGKKDFAIDETTTVSDLKKIIQEIIEENTKKSFLKLALRDKSIRKMIFDEHLSDILAQSLNNVVQSNYDELEETPLNEVVYSMAPQSQKYLEKAAYKTEEEKAKKTYIENNIQQVTETIEKLRKDTNYLISNPQGTGKELLEKTIYCNISMHDRMAKAGNIREAMNSIEKIKGNTVTVTSFDLETIGSAITEIGFDTAKRTIDENFRQIGKDQGKQLSELFGIDINSETGKSINNLLSRFSKASKREKEKIINSNEGYILKYLTMIGKVTGGSVDNAKSNGSIGLEEAEGRYFSKKFAEQNTVNLGNAIKGLEFFSELHDIQSKHTVSLDVGQDKYDVPAHEKRLLDKLKEIIGIDRYVIGHNAKAFDLNKLRTYFMYNASEGAKKYYLENYKNLLNEGYYNFIDTLLVYRHARGPEEIAKSPNTEARLLGETEHTNTAMALHSGKTLSTMHVALTDAEITADAFFDNDDISNFVIKYFDQNNKIEQVNSDIDIGSILLGTSGNIPSKNGKGILGFTYDPFFEENNGIRYAHPSLNGANIYTSFADTIKKGSVFEVKEFLQINTNKIDQNTLDILRKIDPQLIGNNDDLFMFVFDQIIANDHDVSKTKTQRHYWIGTKKDLSEQISNHFEHIANKTSTGKYSTSGIPESVKERWAVDLSTVDQKDIKYFNNTVTPGEKYAFSADYLISRGIEQAQKDTALSSLRRSTAGNIRDLFKVNKAVNKRAAKNKKEEFETFKEMVAEVVGNAQEMAKAAEDIFGLNSATQNKLFNVLSLYDMYGSNLEFFGMINSIIAKGGLGIRKERNARNLIYGNALSEAIDLMQEIVDKSLDSEYPLKSGSPVFKYMEDIVELGYKSGSSLGKVIRNPSRKNKLRSLQIDINGNNYGVGDKLLSSGAYSSQRTREGAYSAFFSDKAGELGFKSDSGKIYNPAEALAYIEENFNDIQQNGESLTAVLKRALKEGKIHYIDRNQYKNNGYETINGYMVSMLKAIKKLSPYDLASYTPSRYAVTEENVGEFYDLLSDENKGKFKKVLSNKLNLANTSYKWVNDNNIKAISDSLIYDVLVSGFGSKAEVLNYAKNKNNKQFAKDLKDVQDYVSKFLESLKDRENGNLGIKINKTSGFAGLIIGNNDFGTMIDISRILPSIRYTESNKDYVMKFGNNVFFNPSMLTRTPDGYDIQSHASTVLSRLQGLFRWVKNFSKDATADQIAGGIEYLGSVIGKELASKTTPVLSEQDLRHKNNFIYEDFFNLIKDAKDSSAFNLEDIKKYLDTEQAKEVIENLTSDTKLTDEDKLKLITDRRGIISYITENQVLKKTLFRLNDSSKKTIEDVDKILKRMMYSMDIVHKIKPQEDMTATSHGYGDLALSRFGARDPRYAQSVLNRSVEHNGQLMSESELTNLDIRLGRGIYGSEQEASHAESHSYRALVLNINTDEYYKNYLGEDFDEFLDEKTLVRAINNQNVEETKKRIKSTLLHSVDNNASVINPEQFLLMAKNNITSVTRDREIVDFDNLYYMISRQHRGLIRNAEKQKEATSFVLDLAQGTFDYKSGTFVDTYDLIALKENWLNELNSDVARRGGILKGGFRRRTEKGDIVSKEEIEKIMSKKGFKEEVKAYAQKYSISEEEAFKKVLSGNKYDLEYIRYVADIDVAATRKYLISQEKTSAVVAMSGAGSLFTNVRKALKALGMDRFIGMQLSDEFIDSLEFDVNRNEFSGLFYEAAFSDAENRHMKEKDKQKKFREVMEHFDANFAGANSNIGSQTNYFKNDLKKERTFAWNMFEKFLVSKNELEQGHHLGAIASTMGDRLKLSHGDIITNLTDILVSTYGATEDTKETIASWFEEKDDVLQNMQVFEDEKSIILNLDENKQYHLKSEELIKTFGKDFFDKKYYYMSFTEANDPKNPGHNLDAPDKGAKIHPLTIGTLEKQRLYRTDVEKVYDRYKRLYQNDAATKFNELFEDVAQIGQDGNIELAVGHEYGEVLMPETIESLRDQVWSDFSDSRYKLVVDKKTHKIGYELDKERINVLFDKQGKMTENVKEELRRRKVSKAKIARLENLKSLQNFHNLSIDKAVTLSSVLDIKEAYEFNYSLVNYDEHDKVQLVEKMKNDYKFTVIDDITKINTVDRVGTTGNKYSIFNSHIIELDDEITSIVGQDMVAVPYMPTSFKGYTNDSEIKTSVHTKEIDFIRAVDAYNKASQNNEEDLSSYQENVRIRFAELNNAIEESHITKASEAKDLMTTRAMRSFSAKGNLTKTKVYGLTPEKLEAAMVDGISLAKRAANDTQVAAVFINRENYIRMLGGVDHLKALYNAKLFDDNIVKNFDLDLILDEINKRGGILSILRRNPENYQVSNIPVHVFLDRSLAPGKIEAEDKLAALLNLDTDGDQVSLAAVLGKHKDSGRAMTSAEAMLMNDNTSDSLFKEVRRASEVIMEALASNDVGETERMQNYIKGKVELSADMKKAINSMSMGGNIIDRVMSSVTNNGNTKTIDKLRERYRNVVASDEFKNALESSEMTLKDMEQSAEAFRTVADIYLNQATRKINSQDEWRADQDALMYMWGNMHDTEALAKKLQQNQAGIINMNTARARSIFLQLQNIAKQEGREIDPNARRSIDAMMIWIEENAQVSKHAGKLSVPELGEAFDSLFGIGRDSINVDSFLDLMDSKYGLFDDATNITKRGELKGQLTQFGYDERLTKEQMSEYMKSLLPEGKVINREYYDGVERQFIRKSALGWEKSREREKKFLTMYYKGKYSEDSLERDFSDMIRIISADGDDALKDVDIFYTPRIKTAQYHEVKAKQIIQTQANYDIPDVDNIISNINDTSLKDVAHGAVAGIGKMFSSSKGILGLAGAIMAAGFIGGNPTAPSGTEARQAVDDSQPYEIPNMIGDMMPQIGQQAPAGYIINVNASSGKGQDYISALMQQTLRSQFPNQNISMTMNINDSSSNISLRDVASYLKDAI